MIDEKEAYEAAKTVHPYKNLRDEFAMAALTGWLANPKPMGSFYADDDAKYCYDIANSMMKERAK